MTKVILKKQMLDVFSWIYFDKKTGKKRTSGGLIGFCIFYIALSLFIMAMFFTFALMLCAPLVEMNMGWLYFAIMSIMSMTLGVFGSVFNTYSTLYNAKDNDLLLSMPIPVRSILVSRVAGVYVMGLMYELMVMIPTVIVYLFNARLNAAVIIFTLLIPIVLSVFILTLSCILGFVVAIINGRLKNQKILTVLVSLVFLGGYFYLCGNLNTILQSFLENPEAVGDKIKYIYPIYHLGMAAQGKALSMLIFTSIVLAFFAVVYLILSKSFLSLATTNKGTKKAKYKEKTVKGTSPDRALLGKEFAHFFGSANYMLNCGLGTVIILVAAVIVLIKGNDFMQTIGSVFTGYEDIIPLIAAAIVCMAATMNDLTAASVSLEGKNIWLAQSLPITGWQALKAKLNMHIILTLIPTAVLTVCIVIVLRPSPLLAALILAAEALFVYLTAEIGLLLNLKMPNLTWTNEIVPIKQSLAVFLAVFGNWGIIIAFALLYIILRKFVSPTAYLAAVDLVLLAINAVLLRWFKTKGSKIFESL